MPQATSENSAENQARGENIRTTRFHSTLATARKRKLPHVLTEMDTADCASGGTAVLTPIQTKTNKTCCLYGGQKQHLRTTTHTRLRKPTEPTRQKQENTSKAVSESVAATESDKIEQKLDKVLLSQVGRSL